MSKGSNINMTVLFVLSVSLIAAAATACLLTLYYRHVCFHILGGFCDSVIEHAPDSRQAVLEVLKTQDFLMTDKNILSNFQTCRAACPPYVVPAFRHKQCMNPASLQFRLSLSRAILSMRISVHYRARRGEWRKTILSRKLICAVILFKHKQLRPRVRTLII